LFRAFEGQAIAPAIVQQPMGVVMQTRMSQLADVQKRLDDAIDQLREQQNLVPDIDCPRSHAALLMLLSNGLRVFCWLENQRNRFRKE
jgi:hypothetical protein